MINTKTRGWQELFVAVIAVALVQLIVLQPSAEAAVDTRAVKPSLASISITPAVSDSATTGIACAECKTPAQLRNSEADLVVTTTMEDGSYVAVWQNKHDNIVYGQSFYRDDQPRGNAFRITADLRDNVLPIIQLRSGGGFVAKWQQDGRRHERRFTPDGKQLEMRRAAGAGREPGRVRK